MNILLHIIAANFIISLISLIGVFTFSLKIFHKKSVSTLLVGFAAGVLLATAVLNVLPEAFEGLSVSSALHWFMYGIVGAFFLERSLLWYHHHHDDTHNINPTATLILFGDGIHNFIDGLAIAAAFIVNPALGITATVAIAAHEIPQELADYSILRHTGMSKNKAVLWNFISALTAIFGGIVGFYVFQESFQLVYGALALTAGLFLYVAAADLIPELHRAKTRKSMITQSLFFIAGIVLMMYLTAHASEPHDTQNTSDVHIQKPNSL